MFSRFFESEHQARKDAVDQLILDVHSKCIRNREALQRVDRCGCFYCLAIFDPQEIGEWIEDEGGDTALCPPLRNRLGPPRIGRVSSDERLPAAHVRLLVLARTPCGCAGGRAGWGDLRVLLENFTADEVSWLLGV